MPTIKQIIAEIQLAPDLPSVHKDKVTRIIREAEDRIKRRNALKPVNIVNKALRRMAKSNSLMSLETWEHLNGQLSTNHFGAWIMAKNLSPVALREMIDEFRTDMLAKGKMYADFARAFQTYLMRGYLSKKFENCKCQRSTFIENRGGVL